MEVESILLGNLQIQLETEQLIVEKCPLHGRRRHNEPEEHHEYSRHNDHERVGKGCNVGHDEPCASDQYAANYEERASDR